MGKTGNLDDIHVNDNGKGALLAPNEFSGIAHLSTFFYKKQGIMLKMHDEARNAHRRIRLVYSNVGLNILMVANFIDTNAQKSTTLKATHSNKYITKKTKNKQKGTHQILFSIEISSFENPICSRNVENEERCMTQFNGFQMP